MSKNALSPLTPEQSANVRAWLRYLLREQAWSVQDLAYALDLSLSHTTFLLKGERGGSLGIVTNIAALTSRSTREILNGRPGAAPPPTSETEGDSEAEDFDKTMSTLQAGAADSSPSVEATPASPSLTRENLDRDRALVEEALRHELHSNEFVAFAEMRARVTKGRLLTWGQRQWLHKACYRRLTAA